MKKQKRKKKNSNKNILIFLAIVVLAIILIIVHFTSKKKTSDIPSHEYKSNIDAIYSNTLFELPENDLDSNIIIENEIDNNVISKSNEVTNEITTKKTDTVKNQNISQGTKYKLEVNCTANVVNVYEKNDENGNYTNCVKVMLCSVGGATPNSRNIYFKKL